MLAKTSMVTYSIPGFTPEPVLASQKKTKWKLSFLRPQTEREKEEDDDDDEHEEITLTITYQKNPKKTHTHTKSETEVSLVPSSFP